MDNSCGDVRTVCCDGTLMVGCRLNKLLSSSSCEKEVYSEQSDFKLPRDAKLPTRPTFLLSSSD